MDKQHNAAREKMVRDQLTRRGIRDPQVIAAMRTVPREIFAGHGNEAEAYEDRPLPIASGQTISQPYMVAVMIEALQLKGGEKVLEVGAGSGYAAAVLANIASHVFAIERIPELAAGASANLEAAGIANVTVKCADGTEGWSQEAPFDAILVSAGAPEAPKALARQLRIGAVMVVPVGDDPTTQTLVRVKRSGPDSFESTDLMQVRFVPLIGEHGW